MLLSALLACQLGAYTYPAPDEDTSGEAEADADADSDADTDTDSDADTDPLTDYQILQDMLAGSLDPSTGLTQVAHRGGWPIQHDGAWYFATLDDGGTIRLAGDHTAWSLVDTTVSNGVAWTQATVSTPEGSRYKWVHDGDYRADPWARAYTYDEHGEISLVRGPRGHLERWPAIQGQGLEGRTVRVWVPPQATTHQLYVHDGQNLFDPDAIGGGWGLQYTVGDSTMVVGIDNTSARLDEYAAWTDTLGGTSYGGLGSDYAAFVLNDVRPLVEAEYGRAGKVGTMGSSMGGLIALTMVQQHPQDWDYAASLSGTVGWGSLELDHDTVMQRYVAEGYFGVPIYLDSGGNGPCADTDGDGINDDGGGTDNYCENRQMADALAEAGWTWDSTLWHWHEAGAEHNEAAWAARVFRPVQHFEDL